MKFKDEASVGGFSMLLVLLGAALLLAFLERRAAGKAYDERQEYARGKAAQSGFMTMTLFVWAMLSIKMFMEIGISYELILWMALYLGIIVYASIAIWMDAYVALTHTEGSTLMSLGMLAAFRWMRFTQSMSEYTFRPEDTECWVDVGALVMFTWIAGLLAVKWLLKKQEEAQAE